MHPGWVDTPGLESSLPRFYGATRRLLRTPQEGADTIVWLGAAPEPARSSGGFWHDRRERPTHRVPWTRETLEDRERLWAECERLSGSARTSPTSSQLKQHKENHDGPLQGNSRYAPSPGRGVRLPQRLLDDRGVGSGGRRSRAARRRADRSGERVSARGATSSTARRRSPTASSSTTRRSAVTFRGENSSVVSLDRITFEPSDERHTNHLRRRARAEGSVQARRPAARGSLSSGSAIARSRVCARRSEPSSRSVSGSRVYVLERRQRLELPVAAGIRVLRPSSQPRG